MEYHFPIIQSHNSRIISHSLDPKMEGILYLDPRSETHKPRCEIYSNLSAIIARKSRKSYAHAYCVSQKASAESIVCAILLIGARKYLMR